MNDALGVRRIQCIGNLDRQVQQQIHLYGLAMDALLERLPLKQFHGDEVPAIGLADFVDRANVRMVQSRCCPGFSLKPLKSGRIFLQLPRQEFQGDVPSQIDVFRLIHHAHAAAAKLLQDTVVRNRLTDH